MKIPIAFPKDKPLNHDQLVLAADVGATKTHLALLHYEEGSLTVIREARLLSQNFDSFEAILNEFGWRDSKPDVISIAFAGPILNGRAKATNLTWNIDKYQLSKKLQMDQVFLINDLEAHAYGLASLKENQIETIQAGNLEMKGNMAIIAPGTGLGEAGLYWGNNHLHPFATEGGHTDFGPRDELDDAFLKHLRMKFGHVSWERVVSGRGIWALCEFLLKEEGFAQPYWLQKNINSNDKALLVSQGAKAGDPLCVRTMQLFFKYLAVEASNLVVKLKATGGLFIGGGVVPKNRELLNIPYFLEHFYDLGRFRSMLKEIPIHIVLDDKTPLYGAAFYGAYANDEKIASTSELKML